MKRKTTFYITLFFCLNGCIIYAQKSTLELTLKNSLIRENLSEFFIEKIVDARLDKDTAAFKKNEYNIEYKFEKSIEDEFLFLLDSAKINDTKRHLILRINELRIQELDKNIGIISLSSNITRAMLNISYIEKIENDYHVLFTASEIFTRKREKYDLIEVHSKNVAKVFNLCNEKFVERLKGNKLVTMPVFGKDTLVFDENKQEGRGLFEDFYDFKYNTIDTSRKFDVEYKLSETENKFAASIKFKGNKTAPWGFRENGVSYVKMGKNTYFPLRKVDGKPSFFYEYNISKQPTLEEVMLILALNLVAGVAFDIGVIAGYYIGGPVFYIVPDKEEALFVINKNGLANFTNSSVDSLSRDFEWISLVNSPYSNERLTYTVNGKQLCPLEKAEFTIFRLPKSTEKCHICVENEQKMKVCEYFQLKNAKRDIIFSKYKKDNLLEMKHLNKMKDYNEVLNDTNNGIYNLRCPN